MLSGELQKRKSLRARARVCVFACVCLRAVRATILLYISEPRSLDQRVPEVLWSPLGMLHLSYLGKLLTTSIPADPLC